MIDRIDTIRAVILAQTNEQFIARWTPLVVAAHSRDVRRRSWVDASVTAELISTYGDHPASDSIGWPAVGAALVGAVLARQRAR